MKLSYLILISVVLTTRSHCGCSQSINTETEFINITSNKFYFRISPDKKAWIFDSIAARDQVSINFGRKDSCYVEICNLQSLANKCDTISLYCRRRYIIKIVDGLYMVSPRN